MSAKPFGISSETRLGCRWSWPFCTKRFVLLLDRMISNSPVPSASPRSSVRFHRVLSRPSEKFSSSLRQTGSLKRRMSAYIR
jgi:hypothetical protein